MLVLLRRNSVGDVVRLLDVLVLRDMKLVCDGDCHSLELWLAVPPTDSLCSSVAENVSATELECSACDAVVE